MCFDSWSNLDFFDFHPFASFGNKMRICEFPGCVLIPLIQKSKILSALPVDRIGSVDHASMKTMFCLRSIFCSARETRCSTSAVGLWFVVKKSFATDFLLFFFHLWILYHFFWWCSAKLTNMTASQPPNDCLMSWSLVMSIAFCLSRFYVRISNAFWEAMH
jgi:hypothetical protein